MPGSSCLCTFPLCGSTSLSAELHSSLLFLPWDPELRCVHPGCPSDPVSEDGPHLLLASLLLPSPNPSASHTCRLPLRSRPSSRDPCPCLPLCLPSALGSKLLLWVKPLCPPVLHVWACTSTSMCLCVLMSVWHWAHQCASVCTLIVGSERPSVYEYLCLCEHMCPCPSMCTCVCMCGSTCALFAWMNKSVTVMSTGFMFCICACVCVWLVNCQLFR